MHIKAGSVLVPFLGLILSQLCFGALTISNFSPQSATVGSGDTQVTIQGSGFTKDSTVQVGADNAPPTFKDASHLVITLTKTQLATAGSLKIVVTTGTETATQDFPVNAADTFPGVDAVIGIGSLITGNRSDYKVNSSTNVLEATQIGRASPQLLVGVAFQLPISRTFLLRKVKKESDQPWHAFVSLKFGSGASQTLVGYVFGITYRVQKYLDILAGYSLTPFNEPSVGFTKAAILAVTQSPPLSPNPYAGFSPPAMNNNIAGAFDGFPLTKQGASATGNLYSGDALVTHNRGGAVIGISVPVSLKALFKIQ